MLTNINQTLRITLLCLSFLFLSGCLEFEDPHPMRIGTNKWVGHLPLYLIKQHNFNINTHIKTHSFNSSSDTIRAFKNNLLDVMNITIDEALRLKQDIPDLQIFLVTNQSKGGDALISHPPYSSILQLTGKRIGLEKTEHSTYFLRQFLSQNHLNSNDFELLHLPIEQSYQLFLQKRLDAIVAYEPYLSLIRQKSDFFEIISSSTPSTPLLYVLVARKNYIKTHTKKIQEFVTSWFRALKIIQHGKPEELLNIHHKFSLSRLSLLQALKKLHFFSLKENNDYFSLESQPNLLTTTIHIKNHLVSHMLLNPAIPLHNLYDAQFININNEALE